MLASLIKLSTFSYILLFCTTSDNYRVTWKFFSRINFPLQPSLEKNLSPQSWNSRGRGKDLCDNIGRHLNNEREIKTLIYWQSAVARNAVRVGCREADS